MSARAGWFHWSRGIAVARRSKSRENYASMPVASIISSYVSLAKDDRENDTVRVSLFDVNGTQETEMAQFDDDWMARPHGVWCVRRHVRHF